MERKEILERLKGLTSEEAVLEVLLEISPSFESLCDTLELYDFDNMGTEESGEDIYTFFFKDDTNDLDLYIMVNPQQDYTTGYYYDSEKVSPAGDLPDGKIEESTFKKIYERVKSV